MDASPLRLFSLRALRSAKPKDLAASVQVPPWRLLREPREKSPSAPYSEHFPFPRNFGIKALRLPVRSQGSAMI